MTTETNNTATNETSTAAICEKMELYGAEVPRGEVDPRPDADADRIAQTITENMHSIAEALDGTNSESLTQQLMYQQAAGLEFNLKGIRRRIDQAAGEIKEEVRLGENGSEVDDGNLIALQVEVQKLEVQEKALEQALDAAEKAYFDIMGEAYRSPVRASYRMHTETAATVDGKTWLTGRANKTAAQKVPEGTQIIITGGREFSDVETEWRVLDNVLAKYPDMVLLHGGAQGVDRIGSAWAKRRNVPQVEFKPDWNKFGKAAGYRRNEEMVRQTAPKAVIAFPGDASTKHCIETATKQGVRVWEPMSAVQA